MASWQWLGADGRPVTWAGTPLPAQELRPVQGRWVGRVGAPPVPGTYGVRSNLVAGQPPSVARKAHPFAAVAG